MTDTSNAPNWLTGILIALAIGAVAAQDDAPFTDSTQAAVQEQEAKHSRDWAAQQMCRHGFEWVDDTTLVCHKEATTTAHAQVSP